MTRTNRRVSISVFSRDIRIRSRRQRLGGQHLLDRAPIAAHPGTAEHRPRLPDEFGGGRPLGFVGAAVRPTGRAAD